MAVALKIRDCGHNEQPGGNDHAKADQVGRTLSARDSQLLLDRLQHPQKPNAALKKAVERFNQLNI